MTSGMRSVSALATAYLFALSGCGLLLDLDPHLDAAVADDAGESDDAGRDEDASVGACVAGSPCRIGRCGLGERVCHPDGSDECELTGHAEGEICRASIGDCDPAETCVGGSEDCPPDELAAAGTTCGMGLFCLGDARCEACSRPSASLWLPADEHTRDVISGEVAETYGVVSYTVVAGTDAAFKLGTNGYLALSDASNRFLPDHSFSIEARFAAAPEAESLPRAIAARSECNESPCASAAGWELLLMNFGGLEFAVREGSGADRVQVLETSGAERLDDEAWHHVVAVRDIDEGFLRIYVDGSELASAALAAGASDAFALDSNVDFFYVGARADSSPPSPEVYFLGEIDDVVFFDRAVSAEEVRAFNDGRCG